MARCCTEESKAKRMSKKQYIAFLSAMPLFSDERYPDEESATQAIAMQTPSISPHHQQETSSHMIVNSTSLDGIFAGFKALFNGAFSTVKSVYKDVAMVVPSGHREEKYGWLGQLPTLREWVGPRVIHNLSVHDYAIKNRKFESTIAVPREAIEDDTVGIYGPLFKELGLSAAQHPDELIFGLIKAGFSTLCYDGQNFFDTDHPVGDGVNTPVTSVSNMQAGGGPAWFLLDTSRAIKPFIFQERLPYKLTSLDRDQDDNVFMEDEYIYGVRARSNAGYGLWQLAFGSKADLTPANYEAARATMMAFKGDTGRPLGIKPDTLLVPPVLEGAAMRLLNNGTRIEIVEDTPVSVQNEWAGTAKPLITPYLV
jgi:phage major head subunit gpT-like protein